MLRFDLKKFSGRLKDALTANGHYNAPSTFRALSGRKSDLSLSAVKNHLNGSQSPNVRHMADYCDLSNESADWLLFGKRPEHPDISKFQQILEGARSVNLLDIPDQDPDVSRILDIVLAMPSEARKKAIEFLELTTMRPKR